MSAPFDLWPAAVPSSGFAARVAAEARRRHVAQQRRRRFAKAVVLGLAACLLTVFGGIELFGDRPLLEVGHRGDEHVARPEPAPVPAPSASAPKRRVNRWPLSREWGGERYPFPLSFAPTLAHEGSVVLHFTPDFNRAGRPGYWGYVAVWQIEQPRGPEGLDLEALEGELRTYYTGLCSGRGHPGVGTQSEGFVSQMAHLAEAPLAPADRALGAYAAYAGEVDARDCIVNGGEITLKIDAVTGSCGPGRGYVAFALSPRAPLDPIWISLRDERRAFRCDAR